MLSKINEAAAYLQNIYSGKPTVGIVLGSGLGSFTTEIKIEKQVDYANIPHFPVSTVAGHSGKLIFGEIGGKKIVAMAGRFHHYEGYSAEEIVFPIRVMKFLGIETLLLSNAAGAMNQRFKVGDLMLINDHVSFFMPNPLVGKNIDALGPRFPDMSEPYKKDLGRKAKAIAIAANIHVHEGVYCSVTGPTFETSAEYRLLDAIGCDVVGMSTVQEAIAAIHMGLPVFAMSVITDLWVRGGELAITHAEVLEAAKTAEPKLTHIFKELIAQL